MSRDEYLPKDYLDSSLVRIYSKKGNDGFRQRLLVHLDKDDPKKCHQYQGFNKFLLESRDLPEEGWKEKRNFSVLNVCDPKNRLFTEDDVIDFENLYPVWKKYITIDNGSPAFLVIFNEVTKEVVLYDYTDKIIPITLDVVHYHKTDTKLFTTYLGRYEYSEIFIGKSELNLKTEPTGAHGPAWDGNSILVKLKSDGVNDQYSYIYVGDFIYQFTTDEPIIAFYSTVGYNDVPYPYAESTNYCYSMCDITKTPITDHPDRYQKGHISFCKNAKYENFDYQVIRNGGSKLLYEVPVGSY